MSGPPSEQITLISLITLITLITPMLAETGEPFDSPDYLFEIKWDGTRALAYIEEGRFRLLNRRFVELSKRYPELAALETLPAGTVLDGEIVVLQDGKPSFRRLLERDLQQERDRIDLLRQRLPATYIVFDLLYLDGHSIMQQPLRERRRLLETLMQGFQDPHLVLSQPVIGRGKEYFALVCSHGLEGMVAKNLNSPYLPGERSKAWLKIKPAQVGSFPLLGFTKREGADVISALIVGEAHGRKWHYKAKVGSGFTEPQRHEIYQRLAHAPVLAHPPADGPRDAIWRTDGSICKVKFSEKTYNGKLRAPVFVGWVDHD